MVRSLALLGSVVVHASVVVALTSHASGRLAPPKPNIVELELTESVLETSSQPAARRPDYAAPSSAARPTHRHAYPVAASHDSAPHDPSLAHAPLRVAARASAPVPPSVVPHATPHFVIRLGQASAKNAPPASAADSSSTSSLAETAVPEALVDVPARLLHGPAPAYPAQARAAQIEADVPLELIVDATGRVVAARLLRAIGYGLDDAALQGVRAFRFLPALRHGRATRVRMRWSVLFRFQ